MYSRKTKIVGTIGPATSSPEMLRRLIDAGLDVARLNLSHGNHDEHRRIIHELRRISGETGREIAILLDLAGPKIRLGEIPGGERTLEPGEELILISGQEAAGNDLPVNYTYLFEDVHVDDRILLADGRVELCVIEKKDRKVYCQVVVGGDITSRKGLNLPTSVLRIPAFTEKDRTDLEFGLKEGVDIVALSFVRDKKDLAPLREILDGLDDPPMLMAKIEKPEAILNLEEILASVEGVMVARGDLGVEMPLEEVPLIQKRVIEEARRVGRAVITATQMLHTMLNSPRPSRAEVTDVANAIMDGTDAVMLSDETAIGHYPVEAVKVLNRLCRATEPHLNSDRFLHEDHSNLIPLTEAALSRAATRLARDIEPAAIIAATTSGSTARLVARYRPPYPVVGFTSKLSTCRQLCLSWGVLPALVPVYSDVDQMFDQVKEWVQKNNLASPGDRLIVTAGIPLMVPGTTNLLKVIEM
ncbi:MAG: pyruvate kinase [Deltaproteobacteria bacterium]|nr:pyruvate kinase [Deltaproteobacteria bacterium]